MADVRMLLAGVPTSEIIKWAIFRINSIFGCRTAGSFLPFHCSSFIPLLRPVSPQGGSVRYFSRAVGLFAVVFPVCLVIAQTQNAAQLKSEASSVLSRAQGAVSGGTAIEDVILMARRGASRVRAMKRVR